MSQRRRLMDRLGYIMRVENSANSIVQVSHNMGKALQQKESQQVKKLFEILKLNWYAVRPGGGMKKSTAFFCILSDNTLYILLY